MKITDNLSTDEITCKCGCGFDKLDIKTARAFQKIRDIVGEPLEISSGCRCKKHNKAVGGKDGSYHPKAKALDIKTPKGWEYDKFHHLCENVIGIHGGVGYYNSHSFVHIDTRGYKARWTM